MHIDIDALRYAVLTAKTLSFARAAVELGVKQATLSKRIASLELSLGFKLFDRSTRGAFPTHIGIFWLEEAKQALSNLTHVYTRGCAISSGRSGTIGIGFSTSLAAGNLRALIVNIINQFPDVRIQATEGDRRRLAQALQSRSIDFAVLTGDFKRFDINRCSLWSERVMIVMSDAHALAGKERIYWPDVRDERFIFSQQDPGADLADLARARLCEPGFLPDIEVHEVSRDNIVNMVPIGSFISLTTDASLGRSVPGVALRELSDLSNGVVHLGYHGYWRADNENPALAQLLKLISDRYPA